MIKIYTSYVFALYLIIGNITVIANTNHTDTILVKAGECKTPVSDIEGIDTFIWNTGNQDIAIIESAFGSVKICGIDEGITYVSGSSVNGEKQFQIIVRVVPDPAKEKITKIGRASCRERV